MDAIPTPIRAALAVFETALADVSFAEINAETLAHAVAEVSTLADAVASAQAALDSTKNALLERQEALFGQVQRAMAYARVYAENDEALMQRLDAISLPRSGRVARAKEDAALVLSAAPQPAARGRRRGAVPVSESMLPGAPSTPGSSVDAGEKALAVGSG
jgi:hypothetical protein